MSKNFSHKKTDKPDSGKVSESRKIVLEILLCVEENEKKEFLQGDVIKAALDKYDYLPVSDKAFIRRLALDCVEKRLLLDYVADCYSKVKSKKMKPAIRNIIRMGCDQILFMDSIPDAAACNEAVKLAESKGFHGLKGFVNGVLRTVSRQKNDIPWPDEKKEPERFLSVKYSVPEWIVEYMSGHYGSDKTAVICKSCAETRPVTVRYRGELTDELSAVKAIEDSGISVSANPYHEHSFFLENISGMRSVPGFNEGRLALQDTASMLAVCCAGIKTGDTVFDLCAAPGGKSCYAAELAGNGQVYAYDISETRVGRIRENAERLGLSNVNVGVRDALVPDMEMYGKCDVVLCDLPCSGLGVIGRKPDIKYRLKKEDIKALAELQKKILDVAAEYVKPGGSLLYSTCTITKEENEDNRAAFLDAHDEFRADSIAPYLPECLQRDTADDGYTTLFTGFPEGMPLMDGFFIARFVRV